MENHLLKNAGLCIGAFLLILLLSSCSKNYFYSSAIEIPNEVWSSEKVAIFEPEITDTSRNFNIILTISNTDDYKYSNVWLFVKTISPDGVSQKDTLQYLMAEESGKWLGKKSGENYEQMLYFKNLIRFPKSGKYIIEIQQGMRDIELKGINKVGILLEEVNQN